MTTATIASDNSTSNKHRLIPSQALETFSTANYI